MSSLTSLICLLIQSNNTVSQKGIQMGTLFSTEMKKPDRIGLSACRKSIDII